MNTARLLLILALIAPTVAAVIIAARRPRG